MSPKSLFPPTAPVEKPSVPKSQSHPKQDQPELQMPTPVLPEIAKDQKDWTEKSSQKSMWDLYKGYPITKEKAKIPIGLEAADRERRATSSRGCHFATQSSAL